MANVKTLAERIVWVRVAQLLVNEKYREGAFKIPIHLALGHETIAVALDDVLGSNDRLLLSHRNIAYNLARARAFKPILDEYLLRRSGLAGGKLGSMNLANPRRGILYSSSILGNNFAVAAGVALALKQRGRGCAVVLGGDGSIEEGTSYESLVFARSLSLPLVAIIENNEWSMSTHVSERRAEIDLPQFSKSIGIQYAKLEGNNITAYIRCIKRAMKSARGGMPVLIEVRVHTLGDWIKEELGSKRFINYHAGPAQKIVFDGSSVVIKHSSVDPVFVVQKKMGNEVLRKLVSIQKAKIEEEL